MKFTRRSFLKWGSFSLASVALTSGLGQLIPSTAAEAAEGELPPAKESDPMPKSLKYCVNAKKPSASCPDRKKKERADQFCRNCQLYTKINGEGAKETGKCLLIPKHSVQGEGWCMSWVKKPGP